MIEAIKDIGEYVLEKEGKDPLDVLIDDPASNPTYRNILTVDCVENNGLFEFKRVGIEPYSKEKRKRYLYKKGSGARGTDLTPTTLVTEIKRTFKTKFYPWFNNILKDSNIGLTEGEITFLSGLRNCIEKNKDKIVEGLISKRADIDKKENVILTLKINGDYLGDYTVFKEILKVKSLYGFYEKYGKKSLAENETCSVCKNPKAEVYGFVDTYKFYTVDKPGFVSGGFNQELAWKNYPVCFDCALQLKAGRDYIDEHLDFRFYGFNYYLIPKLISKGYLEEILEILEDFRGKNPEFKQDYINLVQEDEEEVFELLSKQQNFLTNNLLFYEKSNSAFRILLYVEDVLPSHLRKLFDTKKVVDDRSIFKGFGKEKPMKFTFRNIWSFYPRTKEVDLGKYFLEITNKIFTNKKIDYQFLLKNIMKRIRKEFRNWDDAKPFNPTRESTHLAFQLLDFLNELNLLKNYNGGNSMDKSNIFGEETIDLDNKIDAVFSEFQDFFDTDAKKAIFLEGALTQFLLNIQRRERGSTPFRSKLQGLNLDEKLVKGLLPKIQNKLEEYDKNYYRNLESRISRYMVQAGKNWKMTKDEISFYFVLGMNLSNHFKTKKEDS